MPRIYMRDYLTLDLRTAERTLIQCTDEAGGESLLVRVAATHAGIVNGNERFYRPDKMMQGTSTWTDESEYPRPVLAHHDEDSDPLGRVLTAKYMDLSYLYRDEYPILNDSVFYCSDAKKRMSTLETVDWVVDNLANLQGYKGLGYIELGLKVTKPDAIAKVNRKEFLTVSVGFSTDSAICSVCHQDWAVDDRCEHELGKKYDGKRCFVISGSMDFNEVSFVNSPADPFATTLSVEKLKDSANRSFFLGLPKQDQIQRANAAGIVLTDALYSSDIEMLGDQNMLDLKKLADELRGVNLTEERALAIRKDLTEFKGENDQEVKDAKKLLSSIRAKIKSNGWGKPAESTEATAQDAAKLEAELAAAENRTAGEAGATTTEIPAPATESALILSDSARKIFEQTECKDANEGVKKVISDLEAAYAGLDDASHKRILRYALGALTSSWYDREDFDSYMAYLTRDTDMVAVPKQEHEDLTKAIDSYEASETALNSEIEAERKAKHTIALKTKDALATMVVMHKVLTAAKGFTNLNRDQIQEEITKRSSRELVSLLDMRDEILDELQWNKPAAAAAAVITPGKAISDKATLTPETTASTTVTQTDSTETPAEPAKTRQIPMTREEAQKMAYRARLEAVRNS